MGFNVTTQNPALHFLALSQDAACRPAIAVHSPAIAPAWPPSSWTGHRLNPTLGMARRQVFGIRLQPA
jgi:hypothetical protein